MPEVFSFIENPVGTARAIERIVTSARDPKVHTLTIDHRKCRRIDHCAEAIATVLVERAHVDFGKNVGGPMPKDPALWRIVASVGMAGVLVDNKELPRGMIAFPLTHGKRTPGDQSTDNEVTAGNLVEYINECLAVHGYTLARRAGEYYTRLVAEVITNAEEHTRRPEWWVAAYYVDDHPDDGITRSGVCRIAIFNFGRSIAESLKDLPPGNLLRKRISSLVARHKSQGFPSHWQEDDLWTLAAIQHKVSRKSDDTEEGRDRGQGTAKMIAAFHHLASDSVKPKMCLVSGRTRVLFDGTYELKRNAKGRLRIAFNASNSLEHRPERRYVHHLERPFPGTLLSLRFTLDAEHLNAVYHQVAGNDRPG